LKEKRREKKGYREKHHRGKESDDYDGVKEARLTNAGKKNRFFLGGE